MRPWAVVTCQQFAAVASDYMDDQLGAVRRGQAWFHLAWCRRCQAYLRQLRQIVAVLGGLPRRAVAPALRDALQRRYLESRSARE